MALDLKTGKVFLLTLASLAAIGLVPCAGAQGLTVVFGPGENAKTVPITKVQLDSPTIVVRSAPVGRFCNVPDGVAVVRLFVQSNPTVAQARPLLGQMRAGVINDDGSIDGGYLPPAAAQVMKPFLAGDTSLSIDPIRANLASGNPGNMQLYSQCLSAPEFRNWYREVIRILGLYYEIAPPQ